MPIMMKSSNTITESELGSDWMFQRKPEIRYHKLDNSAYEVFQKARLEKERSRRSRSVACLAGREEN